MSIIMLLFILIALALTVALYVLIGIYVYRDAKSRGMNASLWTVIAILVPSLIGVVIYLLARNSMPEGRLCAKCSTPVLESFIVCPKCGYELAAPCPGCGRQNPKDWRICPYCKAELPASEQAVKVARRTSPVLIVAIIALVVIVFGILATGLIFLPMINYTSSGIQTASVENNMPDGFSNNFMFFDGEKSQSINLEKDQTLTIKADMGADSGSITADIIDPSGAILKHIDGNFTDLIIIKAEQTGNYTIHIKLNKCKGRYSFAWTVQ